MLSIALSVLPFLGIYPIDPVPLRRLIDEADVIAVVETTATLEKLGGEDYEIFGTQVAKLRPITILKGSGLPGRIEVLYENGMICPAPAHFEAKATQLVFLKESDTENYYESVALSYGTPTLDERERKTYEIAIQKWLAIPLLPEEEQQEAKRHWMVRLTLHPHTRSEGLLELNPNRYSPSHGSDGVWPYSVLDFSDEQKDALVKALLKTEDFGYQVRNFYHTLKATGDPRLAPWLLSRLRKATPRELRSSYGDWLHELLRVIPNEEAEQMFHKHWKPAEKDSYSDQQWVYRYPTNASQYSRAKALIALYP